MAALDADAGSGNRLRQLATAAGLLLSVGGLAWVVRGLLRDPGAVRQALADPRLLLTTALAIVAYAALLVLPSLAWGLLMRVGGVDVTAARAVFVWLQTNIAKYLPGNVFHFVGRHALGRRHGWSHGTQIGAVFGEIAVLAAAATLILASGWAVSAESTGGIPGPGLPAPLNSIPGWLLLVAAAGAAGVALALAAVLIRRGRGMRRDSSVARRLVLALGLDVAFLASCGLLLLALLMALGTSDQRPPALAVVGAYGLAWLAGTVTFGAPAGLGVREAVLVWQLGGLVTVPVATVAALGLRLVTTFGDVLAAGVAWGLDTRGQRRARDRAAS